MKKKEDIHDYCSAGEAAAILSQKLGRPIRPDYINKLAKSKKRAIRTAHFESIMLYHRDDIEQSQVRQKRQTA